MTGGLPQPPEKAQRDRSWPWIATAVFFVVLSPVAANEMRTSHGGWFRLWLIAQVMATGAAWAIPEIRKLFARRGQVTAEQSEFQARISTVVRMNDALDPVMTLLGNLAAETDGDARDRFRAQVLPLVLAAAADLIGVEGSRSRACYFRLEQDERGKRLVPAEHAGRSGSPSTTFVEGTPAGDAAIGMVIDDEDRLCRDIDSEPPPGWDGTKARDYRTFISVSVIASDNAYGMLTLDALHPGDLTRDDMRLLRLLAGALALAQTMHD